MARQEWDTKTWEDLIARVQSLLANEESEAQVRSEFSPTAVMLALGAMLVSYHKYGAVADGYPKHVNAIGTPDAVDRRIFASMGSSGKRLSWYYWGEKTPDGDTLIEPGNVEYLIDAMNFLMIEFMYPAHPKARYQATDRWGSPGRVATNPLFDGAGVQHTNRDLAATNE